MGTKKEKCSTCGKKGHSTEDCWHGKDTNKADTRKTKMAAGSKNDRDLMSLLNMVKQWHQQRTQQRNTEKYVEATKVDLKITTIKYRSCM